MFGYSLLYALPVDVLMVADSRYDAERWLKEHASSGRLVALAFDEARDPRMEEFNTVNMTTVENLRRWNPDYFVLNADYARALGPHRPEAALVAGLQRGALGYRLVYRRQTPAPWPWLPAAHPDLVGPHPGTMVLSFLSGINPTIEIYERNR